MRMKAAVLDGTGEKLSVEEVELDDPKAGEVRVHLTASGVCRSDIKLISGESMLDNFPVVLGHEGAGVVDAVGEGVASVSPGDHVILTFLPACGKCRWCHSGQPTLCDLGALLTSGRMLDGTTRLHRADGSDLSNFLFVSTWAEYTVVAEASVLKIPEHLPLEKVCLLGCGFTTGFGAASNAVHVRPGETATVIGCGGLGLAGVQALRMQSAGKIIAVDIHPEKLEMAKHFGATHAIVNRHDPEAVIGEIMDITWGLGTDFAFDYVGFTQSPETIRLAFDAIRKGGHACIVGVGDPKIEELPIDPYTLAMWRKQVQGVLFGDAQFRTDIPRYLQLYDDGRIDLDGMITAEYPIEKINDAVDAILAQNRVARQVIRYD
ncbi:MAG: Zn-dependent alcohol dehydrogenase [bacterium]